MGASAARMNPSSHQLFTCATFAGDQYSGRGRCHPLNNIPQREDFGVLPKEGSLLQGGLRPTGTSVLQSFLDSQQQFIWLKRFREVIKSAEFHSLNRG